VSNAYLGLDIGGSGVKAGVVTDTGQVLACRRVSSVLNRDLHAGLTELFQTADDVIAESGIARASLRGIGVAAPGTMDIQAGVVFHPFNLPGWEDLPLARIVADHFGRPAWLQNDANAAAYGEFWVGAARDASSLMFWTLGTGVGGGIILDGKIWTGAHDHAGECGHAVLQMDGGPKSEFGIDGSVELYAGAKALVRRCRAALDAGAATSMRDLLKDGRELTPVLIAEAAEQGDPLANDAIMESARCLGIATVSIIHILNPAIILIGGAMTFGRHETDLGRRFLQRVRAEVRRRAFPVPGERTIIDYASLGGDAGFIGAAGYARLCAQRLT
jgi:glucokinase